MSLALRVGMSGLAAVALMTTLVPTSRAFHPHDRKGPMVGISIGGGESEIELSQDFLAELPEGTQPPSSEWIEGYAPGFRLGYGIGNHFMISFENRQWLDEGAITATSAEQVDKLRVNTQHYSFVLTVFPASPKSFAGGIYIQAGVGWSNSRFTILEPHDVDENGNIIPNEWGENFEEIYKEDDPGTAYSIGAGYEFRIMKRVAAGVAMSYNYLDSSGQIFDKSRFVPITWTLNWYW
jgi:opacity protein-like surface antigen